MPPPRPEAQSVKSMKKLVGKLEGNNVYEDSDEEEANPYVTDVRVDLAGIDGHVYDCRSHSRSHHANKRKSDIYILICFAIHL